MKLIVGLGNIGSQYAQTRHNLGFMVVDELAQRSDLSFKEEKKLHALVAKGELAGETVLLAKPTTMMNLSGGAMANLMHYYKLTPSDVWVVHDELDLEFGKLRVRGQGTSAGHNGIESIIAAIGDGFVRWRLGIGRPTNQMASRDYVLQPFNKDEPQQIPQIVDKTASLIERALASDPIEPESFNLLQ